MQHISSLMTSFLGQDKNPKLLPMVSPALCMVACSHQCVYVNRSIKGKIVKCFA